MTRARLVYYLNEVNRGWWLDEPWTNRLLSTSTQDKLADLLAKYFTEPAAKLICRIWGHVPTRDHCGLPAHDYCLGCNEPTPGQAQHRAHWS